MPQQDKKRVAVIVGSGFSSALTGGETPILGNKPLPTLGVLTDSLLQHMEELETTDTPIPFSKGLLQSSISVLRKNAARPESEKYNFEEFISLLSIGAALSRATDSSGLTAMPGSDPRTLRCILYCLSDFFASRLSYDEGTKANRNFFYRVNDVARAKAMKEGIWKLVDECETTFISFNYDGIVEAFLDHWLGEDRGFRYLVELSHAIPLAMPEHVYSRRDNRDFSRLPRVPLVLKPHGSIHFFQLREELRGLMSGPTMAAVQPRLDIGFNPSTGQRDIPDIQFWEFADPVPVIIPPLLNKDSYFGGHYFQAMLRLVVEAVQKADHVLVIGFSLPPSDLHVCAAFETIDWTGKTLGLVSGGGSTDKTRTEDHWRRAAGSANFTIVNNTGLPVNSVAEINAFWDSIRGFLQT